MADRIPWFSLHVTVSSMFLSFLQYSVSIPSMGKRKVFLGEESDLN